MTKRKEMVAKESNQLIRAKYSLTRNEKRVMGLCAHKLMLKDFKREGKHGIAIVTVKTAEFAELHGISLPAASTNLRASIESIEGKSVKFPDPENDTIDEKGAVSLSWVIGSRDKPKQGSFELALNPLMEEHLFLMDNEFTIINLIEQGILSNAHFGRLYGAFCDHHRNGSEQGKIEMSIPWMIERYQLPKSYERMSDFRRRFLHPAVQEISEFTPFNLLDDKGDMTVEEFTPKGKLKPSRVIFNYTYKTKR